MKLSETINYINSALNYPSIDYTDVSLFFDMAIAELNTTLHTAIPSVKDMVEEFRRKMSKPEGNKVYIANESELQSGIPAFANETAADGAAYFYNTTDGKFYIKNGEKYKDYDTLEGIVTNGSELRLFQSMVLANAAIWVELAINHYHECELGIYLPDEWVLLWLIPYVCFKYTCRDGGTAQTFAEELTQGYQQLQETYNVPDKVLLATYADKSAYTDLVSTYLPNLNIWVRTRAIYSSMKHSRNTNAIFGGFYDRGGF